MQKGLVTKVKDNWISIFLFIIVSVIVFVNINNPFFWDKDILDSKQAHFFLQNHFKFILSDQLDNGHFPFMGFLLAVLWSIFGKSLIVGHVLMYFIFIILFYQLRLLIKILFPHFKWQGLILAVVLAETSLLTQVVVVSSDLVLSLFFVISLNGIFKNKQWLLLLGVIGLSILSIRSQLTLIAIFIFLFYYKFSELKRNSFSFESIVIIFWPFVIAFIFPAIYYVFHYHIKGWIMLNEKGNWGSLYELVNVKGVLRNLVIFSWRMVDDGRIFVWLLLLFVIFYYRIQRLDKTIRNILAIFISLLIVYLPFSLFANSLIDNRYYIPLFITFYIGVVSVIIQYVNPDRIKIILLLIVLVSIISGNFWVYPRHLSTCWSASMAHLPYFKLKDEMNNYIEAERISKNKIKSFVPNVSENKFVYLNDDNFKYGLADVKKDDYIFFSNVFNCTDDILQGLQENYTVIKRFEKYNVEVILYERNKH